MKVESSGAIIKLEPACPWTEHLFELEKEMDLIGQIKFVLYKESERDRWRIQVSSSSSTVFINCICSIILVRSSSYRIIYKQVLLYNDYVVVYSLTTIQLSMALFLLQLQK